MVITGLEVLLSSFPEELKGKRAGVLCHAPSVTRGFEHISDILFKSAECRLTALFGPQHGIHGQTQDNMIEWQTMIHPVYKIPVYSLYGEHRKPSQEMLANIDFLIVDLQDVGTRIYTYVWTMKLCMEACTETGIPVVVLDRPNPASALSFDGPVLKDNYFTFVGGASIPLCHRMTTGEIAVWLKEKYYPSCRIRVIWMEGWRRGMQYKDTGLPWVLPSPNMPTVQTTIVYPGTVLIEALNMSEGRGTTIPFELFGAPFINTLKLKMNLSGRQIKGCAFRIHDFIPTFHKFSGELCGGIQVHVTDLNQFRPVETILHILDAVMETSAEGSLLFNSPPYEYEYKLMPFDILAGDQGMRECLLNRLDLNSEIERWKIETESFYKEFREIAWYKE